MARKDRIPAIAAAVASVMGNETVEAMPPAETPNVAPNGDIARTQVDVQLNDTNRHVAFKAVENFYKAYNAKNGVADLEKKLEVAKESLSSSIFELAHVAQRLTQGKAYPGYISAYFGALCNVAEIHIRAKMKIDKEGADPALATWGVYKSNILKCIKGGADGKSAVRPLDYQSLTAMTKAWAIRDASVRETERGARNQGGTSQSATADGTAVAAAAKDMNIAAALQHRHPGISTQLLAVVTVMDGIIGKLDHSGQDLLAQKLSQLLSKFADKLAKDDAAREAPAAEQVPDAAEDAEQAAVA